jgi:glutaredoxin 3
LFSERPSPWDRVPYPVFRPASHADETRGRCYDQTPFMPASVVVYRTDYCGYCHMAKRLLNQKGHSFREIDASNNAPMRRWLMQTTRQRTVPQIFINGHPIGGYTELAALDRAGRLDKLLAEEPPANAMMLPGLAESTSA